MISPPRFLAKARAGLKKSVRRTPYGGTGKAARLPTFEQVKDSFLALVQELKVS
jgi:hypothetical protein